MATRDKFLIRDGVLESYLLSAYSARRLGLTTTGNAGGAHNVFVSDRGGANLTTQADVLREMGRGLLVTEFLGQGVNPVTGDYSRGVSGFWVDDGAIVHPVEGVTVAGNLKDMFANVLRIGDDIDRRGNVFCGTLVIDGMTIAGS